MRYDFAPMEGLTDSIYRRAHHRYFSGVDRYYMPFISPTVHRSLTPREERALVSQTVIGELHRVLTTAEFARYAPASDHAMQDMYNDTTNIINQ